MICSSIFQAHIFHEEANQFFAGERESHSLEENKPRRRRILLKIGSTKFRKCDIGSHHVHELQLYPTPRQGQDRAPLGCMMGRSLASSFLHHQSCILFLLPPLCSCFTEGAQKTTTISCTKNAISQQVSTGARRMRTTDRHDIKICYNLLAAAAVENIVSRLMHKMFATSASQKAARNLYKNRAARSGWASQLFPNPASLAALYNTSQTRQCMPIAKCFQELPRSIRKR